MLWLAPPLTGLALILAACGGAGATKLSPTTTTTTTTSTTSAAAAAANGGRNRLQAQLQPYEQCMASQGEPLPTFAPRPQGQDNTPPSSVPGDQRPRGGFGGGGTGLFLRGLNASDPKVQAAYNACKSKIPASVLQQQQQRQQQMTAFISCMKDHGVTITTGPPAPGTTPTTLDRSSAAYQTCKVLLPVGPGGGQTTPTIAQ